MRLRWLFPALAGTLLGLTGGKSMAPAALPVRRSEGTLHGFLELRSKSGDLIAHGDLLQVPGPVWRVDLTAPGWPRDDKEQ